MSLGLIAQGWKGQSEMKTPHNVAYLERMLRRLVDSNEDGVRLRTQDLIDLQLIFARENVDYSELRRICQRLFANRKTHAWPPQVQASESMRLSYEISTEELTNLLTYDEAVAWANDLITRIEE
jgi:hypothetical protein